MTNKHTPGPWEWDGKFTVSIPHHAGLTAFRTNPEDARLIAAAPDLLHELRTSRCPGGGYNGQPENEEPIVENCLKAGNCGCSAGAAVRKAIGT